jgi:aerobic carbon-monoxide dehydrogenase medium subunit
MKPPAFDYHRPSSVDEALALLAAVGDDGKVLAGGQSLVPILNMRLASPVHLVDINRLAELAYVRSEAGGVRVGALARHADVERDAAAHAAVPLLRQATACVAHAAIRNRGTSVGSLVHADPAAELPGVLALLGGTVTLARAAGRREVGAADFFLGPLESAIRPDELAVEAWFPAPPPRSGTAWLEVSRRHGDYALCGVGVLLTLDEDRRIAVARAVCVAVGPAPVTVDLTYAVAGAAADAADWSQAAALASAAVAPDDDIHATAAYRRHLAGVLVARAGRSAAAAASAREGV